MNIAEMRHHAMGFYCCLYTAGHCDSDCAEELFQGLSKLDSDSKTAVDSFLTSEQVSSAPHSSARGDPLLSRV